MTTDKITILYSKNRAEINKLLNNLREFEPDIIRIAEYHKIPMDFIFLPCRNREIVDARQCLTSLIRERYNLHQTGRLTGGYDHTTVINSCRAVSDRRDTDKEFNSFYKSLTHFDKASKKRKVYIEPPVYPTCFTSLAFKPLPYDNKRSI